MAHWALVDENNIVTQVIVVQDSTEEEEGRWIAENLEGRWYKTSYNTYGNQHKLGGIPFRKNYAGIGYKYDEERNAFIPPKPNYPSWILDEETCLWKPPIPRPEGTDQDFYFWDENVISWILDPERYANGVYKTI